MYKYYLSVIIISLCFINPFCEEIQAFQERTIDLRYKTAGAGHKYIWSNSQETEMEMMGNKISGSMLNNGEILRVIKHSQGGKLSHELSFTSLSSQTGSELGQTFIDTRSIVNKSLKVISGEKGDNPVYTNFSDMPMFEEGGVPPAIAFIELMIELPKDALHINGKWKSGQEIEFNNSDVTLRSTGTADFTLASIQNYRGYECAKITGTFTSNEEGTMTAQGMSVDFETERKGEVTVFFAIEKGIIVELLSNSEADMNLDLTGMNLSVPMTITSQSKFVLY